MENSIKMIKQIEQTHSGLGIPLLFSNISVLARTSVLELAEKGVGKGTIVRSTKPINVQPQYDMQMDSLTMLILANKMKQAINANLLWRVKEWSTLSQYHRNFFLSVGSQIITDHSYEHQTGNISKPINIKISNCFLTVLIAITPLKFQRMITENENWESLTSDRFIKFIVINPLRNDTVKSDPIYDLPNEDLSLRQLPRDTELKITNKILQRQITEERRPIFARDLINAYCIFEGYEKVTQKAEIEFAQLFNTYIGLYPALTYTGDIERQESVALGGLRLLSIIARHEGISLDELVTVFNVYDKKGSDRYDETIMKHTKILTDRNLIQIESNSPKKFYMSNRLQDYFAWYRSLVN